MSGCSIARVESRFLMNLFSRKSHKWILNEMWVRIEGKWLEKSIFVKTFVTGDYEDIIIRYV